VFTVYNFVSCLQNVLLTADMDLRTWYRRSKCRWYIRSHEAQNEDASHSLHETRAADLLHKSQDDDDDEDEDWRLILFVAPLTDVVT
jgi:hypothetical protein